jgi:hypothetical protein
MDHDLDRPGRRVEEMFHGVAIALLHTEDRQHWAGTQGVVIAPDPAPSGEAEARRRRSAASGGSLKLRCVYLEVTLLNGQNYSIPVEEGHSVEEELELFLSRDGRYAGDWVPLQKASRELFVRYEQIADPFCRARLIFALVLAVR